MTKKQPVYSWKLRQLMSERGLWKTSELGALLEAHGVTLSAAGVYRLVTAAPERLSMATLVALCHVLACTPNDLIELGGTEGPLARRGLPSKSRPRRARVL